jgi:cohesin complex subunit SCC1
MFLPEDLLYKSGQLARVWLAANQHKKLTKAQVLQDKIDEDIEVIIRPEGAAGGPLALRLNGQLLLGVVRIYHRKAHYLHDDCNDALWKIKMVRNTHCTKCAFTDASRRLSVQGTSTCPLRHMSQTPQA